MVYHHYGYGDDCDGNGGDDGDSDLQGCCDMQTDHKYLHSSKKKCLHAGIYFCLNDRGLPTGEAFIEMETPQVVVLTF